MGENRLSGSRVYLCGAMDRAADGGEGWRKEITPVLENFNMVVINPINKPIHGYDESKEFIVERRQYKKNRQFEKIVEHKRIRSADLRLVDISDLLIVYLNMDERPFGTIEEIVTANRSKKPVLVWVEGGLENAPDWLWWMLPMEMLFDNMWALINYIDYVDAGLKNHERFIFTNFKA